MKGNAGRRPFFPAAYITSTLNALREHDLAVLQVRQGEPVRSTRAFVPMVAAKLQLALSGGSRFFLVEREGKTEVQYWPDTGSRTRAGIRAGDRRKLLSSSAPPSHSAMPAHSTMPFS